jgi:hypothetical protein
MRVAEDRKDFLLIEGATHTEAREDELQRLRGQYPPRVGSIYQAYVDFLAEYGHEPTKPRLKKWAIAHRYSDLPDIHDAKGWTRLWSNSGLLFLEPYPPTRCDPDLLKELDSEGLF